MKLLYATQLMLAAAVALTGLFVMRSAQTAITTATSEFESRLTATELAVDRHDQMLNAILATKK